MSISLFLYKAIKKIQESFLSSKDTVCSLALRSSFRMVAAPKPSKMTKPIKIMINTDFMKNSFSFYNTFSSGCFMHIQCLGRVCKFNKKQRKKLVIPIFYKSEVSLHYCVFTLLIFEGKITISTLLFFCLFCGVSFGATG